jgi:DNA polymerase V
VGLVDCNSFYASCERIFRPDLDHVPIAVLSNNDGCVVAMSRELKEAGIPRGAPYFKVRDRLDQLTAAVFSSNYTLYQDISDRVMEIISSFGYECEIYSIDEAFITVDGDEYTCERAGRMIRREVRLQTGVPVSVGFGRTKTLAKLANRQAKRADGVYVLTADDEQRLLSHTPVTDVWGIGSKKGRFLLKNGVSSAWQLRECRDEWVNKHLSFTSLRTLWELRGRQAVEPEPQQLEREGILTSLGFGQETGDLADLENALTQYAATAVGKLQQQGSQTSRIMVFLQTSRFSERRYANSMVMQLPESTSYLPDILAPALRGLRSLFIEGFSYAKVGIYLSDIDCGDHLQRGLFDETRDKKLQAARSIYEIQRRHGQQSITCRNPNPAGTWGMQRRRLSRCYTTRWDDLPHVV